MTKSMLSEASWDLPASGVPCVFFLQLLVDYHLSKHGFLQPSQLIVVSPVISCMTIRDGI